MTDANTIGFEIDSGLFSEGKILLDELARMGAIDKSKMRLILGSFVEQHYADLIGTMDVLHYYPPPDPESFQWVAENLRIVAERMKPGAILIIGYGGGENFLKDSPFVRYLPDLGAFIRVNPPESSAAGLEERQSKQIMRILAETMPNGPGVLVIEAGVISRRMGLAEFVARVPRRLGDRIILFGAESVEAKEIAARNGIAVVDSDKLSDLAFQLMVLEDEADEVGFLGNPVTAAALSKMLPMEVTSLDSKTALDKLLFALGYPVTVLDAINAAGAEELFAWARAA